MLRETTTIGVRFDRVERTVLERELVLIETEFGPLTMKLARDAAGEVVNAAPEHDACAAAAARAGVPLKHVYAAAIAAWHHRPRHPQPRPVDADRRERVADRLDRHAEVDQCAQRHVAGDAADAVEVEVLPAQRGRTHGLVARAHAAHAALAAARAHRTAATAAPKPLSMLTTVTPGAHDVSIAASAASPPAPTP